MFVWSYGGEREVGSNGDDECRKEKFDDDILFLCRIELSRQR